MLVVLKYCACENSCGFKSLVKLEGRCHKIQKHPRGDDFFNDDLFFSMKFEDLRLFFLFFFFGKNFKGFLL